ncbi:MAG: CehA/McbA family metallohydrolase [Gammaproteobacteria bacterium]|nr:CehA/McbA family metallohydrolase [Gammaproteobacteria bacterium]
MLLGCLITVGASAGASAMVRVLIGPTPIPSGSARAAGDITVVNERLAFALAVDSPAPYGVPRGALVALAPVRHGQIGRNRVVFADFIPNNWSAWPNTYHHLEILERGPGRARIRSVRDWGEVTITTVYTLASGSDQIAVTTTMSNGGTRALEDLLSGLTLWPNSGFLFPVPGLAGVTEGSAAGALADRVVAYDSDWAVTLHATYLDHVGSSSRDLFLRHTLAPGATRSFEGWLQVGTSGDLAPVVAAEIARRRLPGGTVRGRVTAAGHQPIAQPVVVVEKDGKPYAWTIGRNSSYRVRLPAGNYRLYASARHYARSAASTLALTSGAAATRDFDDLQPPGAMELEVTDAHSGNPLDARIDITAGDKPVVQFLGHTTFFTALERKGQLAEPMAPGTYDFAISSGGGFLAEDAAAHVRVMPGKVSRAHIAIEQLLHPQERGWYAADLHHHADQAEAVTPPPELARSQFAAGLDVLFVSDHDSTVNTDALRRIAAARQVPCIPGIELSPSWGHFNAYPLDPGARLAIDTSTASVGEIFAEARREGARVVQVNHPFIPYGYFASLAAGTAPGGFNPGFDLIEINSAVPNDDTKVLERTWGFWNEGQHYYLSAGSDTHDVWNEQSGRVRVYVHPDTALSADSFVAALKAGHAYVTYGPLIIPTVMFGTDLAHAPGAAVLGFDLASVAGLKQAQLVSDGRVLHTQSFAGAPREAHVEFALPPERARWYALVVEDQRGRKAYTDPIWTSGSDAAPGEITHAE